VKWATITLRHLLVAVLFIFTALGQTQKWSTTVAIKTSIDAEGVNSQVTSYIGRELRALGDITVVEETANPDHILSIIGFPIETTGSTISDARQDQRYRRGFALAYVLEAPLQTTQTSLIGGELKDSVLRDAIMISLKNRVEIEYFGIEKDGSGNLDKLCKSIVANLDTEALDILRKGWNNYYRRHSAH